MALFSLAFVVRLTMLAVLSTAHERAAYVVPAASNLSTCTHNAVGCPNPTHVILHCDNTRRPICRYRCPLGRPLLLEGCGDACPNGYHVRAADRQDTLIQTCALHKTCPSNQQVILPGSLWHDTICGQPDDYTPMRTLVEPPASTALVDTLNELTKLWMAGLTEEEFMKLRKYFSPSTISDKIVADRLFADRSRVAEHLYSALNALSLLDAAARMHKDILKPFMSPGLDPTGVKIESTHEDPLAVDVSGDTLIVQARATVPLGGEHIFRSADVMWYGVQRVSPMKTTAPLLVSATNSTVNRVDRRCDIAKGAEWNKDYARGFFVYAFDISLIVKSPSLHVFRHLEVELWYDRVGPDGNVTESVITRGIHLKYVWKHKRHADCHCANTADYTDRDGPCSPSCVPFSRVISGLPGTNNDWKLEVFYNHAESTLGRSRVVHGSVKPNTEIFCVVTPAVFSSWQGPTAEAPSAPLDLMRCDVTLLEFNILTIGGDATVLPTDQDSVARASSKCTRVPVRSLEGALANGELCVPSAVKHAIAIIDRQRWRTEIGVKLRFHNGSNALTTPTQEELSGALDWLALSRSDVQIVVIDASLEEGALLDLDLVSTTYGSRFDVKPGLTSSALAELMLARGIHAELLAGLTPRQTSAENTLRTLGRVVSRHGAFLDLTNVRVPFEKRCCDTLNPQIWRAEGYSDEHELIVDVSDVRRLQLSGLYVFDELSRRSNNRGGIIVSLPSSAYELGPDCVEPPNPTNRYNARSANALMYSEQELSVLALDMARWGVSRYGLGYLDYTFARASSVPLFTVLANAVEVAATRFRTLHYRYTRNLAFGDGGFSSVEVNGVYKLEAGMFFRRVSDKSPRVKSFVSMPGVPELEFGLSSDMNVGSTLPISKLAMASAAREMSYIPYGAKTVLVNRSGVVVFVDTDRDVICYHVPPPTTPGAALRTLPFGVAVKHAERNLLGVGCVQSVPGDRRHTRLAVTLPARTETEKETLLENIRLIRRSMSEPVLSLEDTMWLSHAADIEQQRSSVESKREAGAVAETHAISLVLQCLQRSSSCLALANVVENGWPQGGTGYPVDVRGFEVEAGVVLKMIVVANHGALTVTLSCDLKPFAFGSHDTRVNRQASGYYRRERRPLLDRVASEIGKIQSINTRVSRVITEGLCHNETCGDDAGSRGGYAMWAKDCVSATERLAAEANATVVAFGKVSYEAEARLRSNVPRVAAAKSRVAALSLVATVLALLINVVCIVMLYCVYSGPRSREHRYRKLQ